MDSSVARKGKAANRVERSARVATLREDLRAGRYYVPAKEVAASLVQRLGLAQGTAEFASVLLGANFQQR